MAIRRASTDPADDASGDPPGGRGTPHPGNTLNELSGEEWLYFTKSIWSTAYPSELGHARRKAHGANKPPRLMCRLIEFFSRSGELVLDPFAGVGGTLLGAAIAQGPRRALGFELDPRWVAVYHEVVADLQAERDGRGPLLADIGPTDPGGVRTFDPAGLDLRSGDALEAPPGARRSLGRLRRHRSAVQRPAPMTMAGGTLAETHANRRTDYAMVSDDPADLANSADYATFLDRMETVLGELPSGPAARPVCRSDRPRRLPGRPVRLHRRRPRGAGRPASGLVPKGDLIWYQAGTRLRPYGYPNAFVPNIAHQHILVLRRERCPGLARGGDRGRPSTRSWRSSPVVAR